MKRAVTVFVIVLAFSVSIFGTASAAIDTFTLDSKAILSDSGTSAVAIGTIHCASGDVVGISIAVTQASGKLASAAQGTTTITCTGGEQTWSVTVNVVMGDALKHGPANAIFVATDATDGTIFPSQVQKVHL